MSRSQPVSNGKGPEKRLQPKNGITKQNHQAKKPRKNEKAAAFRKEIIEHGAFGEGSVFNQVQRSKPGYNEESTTFPPARMSSRRNAASQSTVRQHKNTVAGGSNRNTRDYETPQTRRPNPERGPAPMQPQPVSQYPRGKNHNNNSSAYPPQHNANGFPASGSESYTKNPNAWPPR
ncbi:hypothetical protein M409DRAFT_19493 [Zasmidium cellare ATCC 36951]|uniref:Uncharacterized protein n=1 Tax=Zasmidium cellare ATCC 36951 TaxID=1080233 RepID=A0A6A6CTU2_ZASCE|nr:uncharacterized protein M409DRAFT_19493 [Zasmidium cellare ATCC 36951]KAF2170677.1 hypothetical protein M409DRAFT_19493 [Zasmidium cellare ATCC 36951]